MFLAIAFYFQKKHLFFGLKSNVLKIFSDFSLKCSFKKTFLILFFGIVCSQHLIIIIILIIYHPNPNHYNHNHYRLSSDPTFPTFSYFFDPAPTVPTFTFKFLLFPTFSHFFFLQLQQSVQGYHAGIVSSHCRSSGLKFSIQLRVGSI